MKLRRLVVRAALALLLVAGTRPASTADGGDEWAHEGWHGTRATKEHVPPDMSPWVYMGPAPPSYFSTYGIWCNTNFSPCRIYVKRW